MQSEVDNAETYLEERLHVHLTREVNGDINGRNAMGRDTRRKHDHVNGKHRGERY